MTMTRAQKYIKHDSCNLRPVETRQVILLSDTWILMMAAWVCNVTERLHESVCKDIKGSLYMRTMSMCVGVPQVDIITFFTLYTYSHPAVITDWLSACAPK